MDKKSGNLAAAIGAIMFSSVTPAAPADYPAPQNGVWTARNFQFHTGQVLPEVRLAYKTLGEPTSEPVLILHGTAGASGNFLNPAFAGELFGDGQLLDTKKYYIILPDALGAGQSAKPSDGLRARFPRYNYDDMVLAQYRLVTEGLGLKRLRLVMGNSMGGMHTWIWGVKHPEFMDALVPMASQSTQMSSRNWMMRRLIIDSIRKDPGYNNGEYTVQPAAMKMAAVFFGIATSGGTLAYQSLAPTREAADKFLDDRLAAPFNADANDYLYQWEASRDYNPSPGLEQISAALLAINAADDERNPPETGIMESEIKRVKGGKLLLIPASAETRGHGTTGAARFWKAELEDFLRKTPKR